MRAEVIFSSFFYDKTLVKAKKHNKMLDKVTVYPYNRNKSMGNEIIMKEYYHGYEKNKGV